MDAAITHHLKTGIAPVESANHQCNGADDRHLNHDVCDPKDQRARR